MTEMAFPSAARPADIHVPLPDAATLDERSREATARYIRGELRPELMRRLAKLPLAADCNGNQLLDRLEGDLRLQQVDAYALGLDSLIALHTPPIPSERMPIRLHEFRTVPGVEASARTELYFSPTTKYVVHGPDVLRYALGLAERVLRPGEALEELEVAHWRRVMLSNLHLTVRAREEAAGSFGSASSDRAVLGTIRTTAGRWLDYWGETLVEYPIYEETGHNECAMSMLRPLDWVEANGKKALRLSLPSTSPYLEELNRSRAFGMFILVELLGLLTGFKAEQASAVHLSVKIEGLRAPDRLGDLFERGVTLEYERLLDQATRRWPHTQTIPFCYRFRPFQAEARHGRMAVTDLSIPELISLSGQ